MHGPGTHNPDWSMQLREKLKYESMRMEIAARGRGIRGGEIMHTLRPFTRPAGLDLVQENAAQVAAQFAGEDTTRLFEIRFCPAITPGGPSVL